MDEKKVTHIGVLISGGIIGAIIGVIAAFILIKSAEETEGSPRLNSKRSVQLGIGIISLLRSLAKSPDLK